MHITKGKTLAQSISDRTDYGLNPEKTNDELKKVRDELRDLTVHKANYEELRDLEEREKRKEKEHGRE